MFKKKKKKIHIFSYCFDLSFFVTDQLLMYILKENVMCHSE